VARSEREHDPQEALAAGSRLTGVVFGLGDEVELGQAPDLAAGDAGLELEGEGLEGPLLGQGGLLDPPGQGRLTSAGPGRVLA
jgi:hypothetical protein